jgi:DNA-binding NarL/FixJ family response regulator
MVTDKLKELEAARAKLASLEQSVADELNRELAQLPSRYGFDSPEAFIEAFRSAAGGGAPRRGRRPGKSSAGASPAGSAAEKAATGGRKRRRRAVITDETRAQVKKMVESGKTGNEISRTLGISLPSVQNIKKALGLVKNR